MLFSKRSLMTPSPTSVADHEATLKVRIRDNGNCGKYRIVKPRIEKNFVFPTAPTIRPAEPTTTTSFQPAPPVSSNMSVFSDTFLDDISLSGLSKILDSGPATSAAIPVYVDNSNIQQMIQDTITVIPPKRGRGRPPKTANNSNPTMMVGLDNVQYPYLGPAAASQSPFVPISHALTPVSANPSPVPRTVTIDDVGAELDDVPDEDDAEDIQAILNITYDFMNIRNITGGFKNMNTSALASISNSLRPQDGYITYHTQDLQSFGSCFANVNALFAGKRYFIRHHFANYKTEDIRDQEVHFILQSMIYFLRNLVTKSGFCRIRSASVLFVTDSRAAYVRLFSLFAQHPAWEGFRKSNISFYTVCTKVADPNHTLSAQERQEMKEDKDKLKRLECKFKDVAERYVFVVTNYKDTVSLFNNFGNFRQKRFANLCVISLDI